MTHARSVVSFDDEEAVRFDAAQGEWDPATADVDGAPAATVGDWRPGGGIDDMRVQVADIEEVETLTSVAALVELRQLKTFDHVVTLSFHADELMFYAAVSMDGVLWRALKSLDLQVAETAFEEFVVQANGRARAEVRRVQLEARNAQLQRMIAESSIKAERLRANIDRNRTLKQRASQRENALRQDIKQLELHRVQAQLQADRNLRQLGQLHAASAVGLPQPKRTFHIQRR